MRRSRKLTAEREPLAPARDAAEVACAANAHSAWGVAPWDAPRPDGELPMH